MTRQHFRYSAFDGKGQKVRGSLQAPDVAGAAAQLRSIGLVPIGLRAARAGFAPATRRISMKRCAEFFYDLGTLLSAGASLTAALSILRQQAGSPIIARIAEELEREISSGRTVAAAFTAVLPEVPFASGLMAAGEASGDLGSALQHASEQLQRDAGLADDLWSALSYPLFILTASSLAIIVLLLVVVPALEPLLEQTQDPPLFLRATFGVSGFLQRFGGSVLLAVLAASLAVLIGVRLGLVNRPVERLILDGPLHRIARGVVFGRFGGVLGRLLASGVPAPEAFRLAQASVQNSVARQRLERAVEKIYEGVGVSNALAACHGVPGTMRRMAAVGEESGALGRMLERAAVIEQDAAIRRLSTWTRWLGPALIVVMGSLIGLLMGSLLAGVTSLGDAALGP